MFDPILKKGWLKMVFENKNQTYGAYELRQLYSKHVLIGFAISASIFALSIGGPELFKIIFPDKKAEEEVFEVKEVVLAAPPPLDEAVPPPPPPPTPPPPKIASIKFLPPVVKPDEEVQEDPPKMEEMKDKVISTVSQEGETGLENAVGEPAKEDVVVQEPAKIEEPVLFAEEMPTFDGGYLAFFGKNLKYPQQAAKMGIEGKVFIEFVVEKDGSITNGKVRKDIGYGCGEEAVRVLNTMPKWTPAKQNGKPTRLKMTLPINFQLQ